MALASEDEAVLCTAVKLLCGEPLREDTAVGGKLFGRLMTVEPWACAIVGSGGAAERWVCPVMMLRASLRR